MNASDARRWDFAQTGPIADVGSALRQWLADREAGRVGGTVISDVALTTQAQAVLLLLDLLSPGTAVYVALGGRALTTGAMQLTTTLQIERGI